MNLDKNLFKADFLELGNVCGYKICSCGLEFFAAAIAEENSAGPKSS